MTSHVTSFPQLRLAVAVTCLAALFVGVGHAHRMLFVPLALPSHVTSMQLLGNHLIRRGHQVHFLIDENYFDYAPADFVAASSAAASKHDEFPSADYLHIGEVPQTDTSANPPREIVVHRYMNRVVDVGPDGQHQQQGQQSFVKNPSLMGRQIVDRTLTKWQLLMRLIDDSKQTCRALFGAENDELFGRLERLSFDVIVLDAVVLMRCVYLLPLRLGVPVWISYVDVVMPNLVRVPWLASFVPDQLATTMTDRMSFSERLQNLACGLVHWAVALTARAADNTTLHDLYRSRYGHFDSLEELMIRSAIWLVTRDNVLDYPKPTMPNMIDVGGLTTGPPTGRLEADVAEFMNGAGGVVLVSLETLVDELPMPLAEKFLTALGRLDDGLRVVWKFDSLRRNLSLPRHVMAVKWMAQNDILAHPKTRLFITHCGNNGQFESLYHEVPMLGFPIFSEQPYNCRRMEHKGFGISMNIHSFTVDQLVTNIHKLIRDTSYRQRISHASRIFRSAVQTPIERASYWIEHVAQFGSEHLHSAGSDLHVYQYYMFDIIAFLFVACCVFLAVLSLACRCLFNRVMLTVKRWKSRGETKKRR
jgi:hypothetical protein